MPVRREARGANSNDRCRKARGSLVERPGSDTRLKRLNPYPCARPCSPSGGSAARAGRRLPAQIDDRHGRTRLRVLPDRIRLIVSVKTHGKSALNVRIFHSIKALPIKTDSTID